MDAHGKEPEFNVRSTLALVGAWCALFCTLGFQNAFGVFQEYYATHMLSDHSEFDIAWIGSLLTFTLFFFAAPAGILVDRVGPTLLLILGGLGTCIAVFMTSLCTQYYQFLLAQGILLGASNAFLFCPAMATVSHLFDKHRSTATGVMISGSSIGGIIWPIMLERLLNQDGVSFGWSFRIVGFVVVALYITIVVTIRMPPKAAPHIEAAEDKTENSSQEQDDQSTAKRSDVSIIKNPTFLVLCAGLSIATFGLFNPLFYISTYAVSRGLSASLSFYLVSILNGASLVGRVSTGILADKYGNFNLCFLTVAFSGIIAMCWTKATTTAEIIVFTLAYGYTSGAMFSLQTPCAAQLATPETRGTAIGLLMVAPAIPGLFGTPVGGRLITHGYLSLSMYSGAALLTGAALVLYARLRQNSKLFAKV